MHIDKNCKISFIVPVYNSSKYIEKCLKSISSQTYSNIEIIVIDDGSTDDSYELCKKIQQKDSRIKIIKQSNKGQSISRNIGIEIASGEWVCFIDSDDWIDNDLCEKSIMYLNDNIEIFFFGYYDVVDSNISVNARYKSTGKITKYDNKSINNIKLSTLDQTLCKNIFSGVPWGKFYRRKVLLDFNIRFKDDVKIYEDSLFVFEFMTHVNNAISIDYPMYYYRTSENSVCKRYRYNAFEETLNNIKYFNKIINEEKSESLYDAYYIYVINCFLNCITLSYSHQQNKEQYFIKRKRFMKDRKNILIQEAFNNCKFNRLDSKTKILAKLVKYNLFFIIDNYKKIKQYFNFKMVNN